MNLEEFLKQFKTIQPDPSFARISRQKILGAGGLQPRTAWRILADGLQFGGAVALAAALFVLLLGGVSALRFLAPFELSGLNPASLRAEADAIEFQIQLTDVIYREGGQVAVPVVEALGAPSLFEEKRAPEEKTTSSEAESITIDAALELLAE